MRDLEWVFSSPSLVSHPQIIGQSQGLDDLDQYPGTLARLGRPGSDLEKRVAKVGKRLGDYFETLVGVWISAVGPATVLAKNLQVHGQGGTVGEFDLVFRRDTQVHHWELAVKFYLGHPGPAGEPFWYGPNAVDRLDLKWAKMLQKQMRLASTPEGKKVLARLGISEEVVPAALIRGVLYESLNPKFRVAHHPDANPEGLRGWWVHQHEVELLRGFEPQTRWMILPRLFWLSAAQHFDASREWKPDQPASIRPLHLAAMVQIDGEWREQSRGFVVPDSWPGA